MAWEPNFPDELGEDGPLLTRRPLDDAGDLDITPMIDITFLLLIFFLVASIPDASTAIDLAPARFGDGVSRQQSVFISIDLPAGAAEDELPEIYLAEGRAPNALVSGSLEEQETAIRQYVEEGRRSGKTGVIISAARRIRNGDVKRVASAAAVDGMSLNFAVYESNRHLEQE